jgi:hypothetical protein
VACESPPTFRRVQTAPPNCGVGTACKSTNAPTTDDGGVGHAVGLLALPAATNSTSLTVTAGNLLVVIAYGGQHPGGSAGGTAPNLRFQTTDTLGNAFHAGPFVNNAKYDDSAVQLFYVADALGGADTVTVMSSAPQAETFSTGIIAIEYSGIAADLVVDLSSSQAAPPGIALATKPDAFTARAGCDLVVGAMANGHVLDSNLTPGTGWEMAVLDWYDPAAVVDNVSVGTSAGGPAQSDIQLDPARGPDDGWAFSQLAFREQGTAPLPQPTQLTFASAAQTVAVGACSAPVIVQASDALGAATIAADNIELALSGGAAALYADPSCSFQTSALTLGAGTSSATFYFRDATAGMPAIAVSSSLPMITQTETVQ